MKLRIMSEPNEQKTIKPNQTSQPAKIQSPAATTTTNSIHHHVPP
jgi:hypothetical protein